MSIHPIYFTVFSVTVNVLLFTAVTFVIITLSILVAHASALLQMSTFKTKELQYSMTFVFYGLTKEIMMYLVPFVVGSPS